MGGLVALVDCNNFYASCERLFQPALIGLPVVVLSNNDGFCNRASPSSGAVLLRLPKVRTGWEAGFSPPPGSGRSVFDPTLPLRGLQHMPRSSRMEHLPFS